MENVNLPQHEREVLQFETGPVPTPPRTAGSVIPDAGGSGPPRPRLTPPPQPNPCFSFCLRNPDTTLHVRPRVCGTLRSKNTAGKNPPIVCSYILLNMLSLTFLHCLINTVYD